MTQIPPVKSESATGSCHDDTTHGWGVNAESELLPAPRHPLESTVFIQFTSESVKGGGLGQCMLGLLGCHKLHLEYSVFFFSSVGIDVPSVAFLEYRY